VTVTYCEECEHLDAESAKGHPARWLCRRQPRLEGHGFVSRRLRLEEPWMRAAQINGGACPMFEPMEGK
jgi:hypothetical protein